MTGDAAQLPLRGTVVVDFSTTLPGPYCTSILLRLGARVFALEPPGGDLLRMQPTTYSAVARGKESVVVNLKRDGDRAFALDLVSRADVAVFGWRPGVADRLGVGYDACRERNNRLVYAALSGFGATGPLAGRPAHDINFQAEAGVIPLAPQTGLPLGDLASGTMGALRIAAALAHVRGGGDGCMIDVSAAGALSDWVSAIGGASAQRFVDEVAAYPHHGTYPTADGEVLVLGVVHEDRLWRNLAAALGLDDWVDLAFDERLARGPEIRAELTRRIGRRTLADLEATLEGVDTAWNVQREPGESADFSGSLPRDARPAPHLDDGRAAAERFITETEPKATR